LPATTPAATSSSPAPSLSPQSRASLAQTDFGAINVGSICSSCAWRVPALFSSSRFSRRNSASVGRWERWQNLPDYFSTAAPPARKMAVSRFLFRRGASAAESTRIVTAVPRPPAPQMPIWSHAPAPKKRRAARSDGSRVSRQCQRSRQKWTAPVGQKRKVLPLMRPTASRGQDRGRKTLSDKSRAAFMCHASRHVAGSARRAIFLPASSGLCCRAGILIH